MDEQNLDILSRIHEEYYQLSAAERKVADYTIKNHSHVQFMSITQLAEECGTADATVSRFCRSLGLRGFNAFKIELAKYSATSQAGQELSQQRADSSAPVNAAQEVGRQAVEAVGQTVELIDLNTVSDVVSVLEKAERVLCTGSGGSSVMAADCAHLFSTVSPKFSVIVDTHLQMSALASMKAGDALLLFSYSGATTAGIQLFELARSLGIVTILVTRFPKSPAASLADYVLLCGSHESPVQQGSVMAKVAQLIVMGTLFQEYYNRNREACDRNRQQIAHALSAMHL